MAETGYVHTCTRTTTHAMNVILLGTRFEINRILCDLLLQRDKVSLQQGSAHGMEEEDEGGRFLKLLLIGFESLPLFCCITHFHLLFPQLQSWLAPLFEYSKNRKHGHKVPNDTES